MKNLHVMRKIMIFHDYDAELITGTKKMADLFEATCAICNKPKKVSNWLMVETMRLLNENGHGAGRY